MAIVASSTAAGAQTNFQVLHDFTAAEGIPSSPLVQATDGNLYGTTRTGGTFNKGTVFVMTPEGVLTVLHSFDGTDGQAPTKAFIQASNGNFYGGTEASSQLGRGAIFRMMPDGTVRPGGNAQSVLFGAKHTGRDG